MKKRIILIGVVIAMAVTGVTLVSNSQMGKAWRKEKIQTYNQEQETNADGIVIDMQDNPYYDKKQPGYAYREPEVITYPSRITGTDRHAMVFLPADYDENKEYPVLYLLHGLNGSHETWKNKSAHIIIQNMYYFDDATEMIVVCPNSAINKEESTEELSIAETIKVYNLTGQEVVENLMPYIETHYPVKTGAENTAVAGNSMGGRNTMYTAFTYPELFDYVGVIAAANVLPREGYNGVMSPILEDLTLEEDFKLLMLAVGKSDDVCGSVTYQLHDIMREKDIQHIFYDTEGGHDDVVWHNALYNFVKRLFRES